MFDGVEFQEGRLCQSKHIVVGHLVTRWTDDLRKVARRRKIGRIEVLRGRFMCRYGV